MCLYINNIDRFEDERKIEQVTNGEFVTWRFACLLFACYKGWNSLVMDLLQRNVDPNESIFYNEEWKRWQTRCATPLMIACSNGFVCMVKILLQNGANPKVVLDHEWHTTFWFLSENKRMSLDVKRRIFKLLLDYNFNIDNFDFTLVLMYKENVDALLSLLLREEVFSIFTFKSSMLEFAVRSGNVNAVKQFVKHGVLLNEKSHGQTAIMYAIEEDCKSNIVLFLCQCGSDLTLQNNNGQTVKDLILLNEHRRAKYVTALPYCDFSLHKRFPKNQNSFAKVPCVSLDRTLRLV